MTVERSTTATERKVKPVGGIMPQEADIFSGNSDLTTRGVEIRLGVFRLAVKTEVVRPDGLLITGEGISNYVDPEGAVDTAGLLLALGPDIGLDLVDRIENYLATPNPAYVAHWSARCVQAKEKRPQQMVMHANRPIKSVTPERGHGRYR